MSAGTKWHETASCGCAAAVLAVLQVEVLDAAAGDAGRAVVRWSLPSEDHGLPPEQFEVETRVYGGVVHSVSTQACAGGDSAVL